MFSHPHDSAIVFPIKTPPNKVVYANQGNMLAAKSACKHHEQQMQLLLGVLLLPGTLIADPSNWSKQLASPRMCNPLAKASFRGKIPPKNAAQKWDKFAYEKSQCFTAEVLQCVFDGCASFRVFHTRHQVEQFQAVQ